MMHYAERTVGHQVRLDMWLAALTLPTTLTAVVETGVLSRATP
jgi:hypothetical protein